MTMIPLVDIKIIQKIYDDDVLIPTYYSLEDLKYPEVGEVFYRRFSDKDLEKIGKMDYTSTKIPKDYPEAVVINQFYIGDATVFYGNNKSLDWNSFRWLFSHLKLEE